MPNYLPSLNYPGSSGYDVNGNIITGPNYPQFPRTQSPNKIDYAVLRPDGTYVSILNGLPYTGTDPHSGQKISGGKLVTGPPGTVQVPGSDAFINPNDPNQRYKPVSITKQPDVAAGQQDLMKTFTDAASSALKDFNQYLSTFKDASKTAFDKTAAATDVGPTVDNLRRLQSSYAGSLGRNADAYAALNAQNAAAERGIVTQATDILPQYDLAAQAIGDRQLAALQAQAARYKMGTGTPTSLGGADAAILARAVADVNLPLQEAKIGRQYDLLQNLALPVQRDIANRETARIAQFNPATAGAIFSSGQGTEAMIQQLKQVTAGMSWQNATQWMTSLGIPAAVQQQILSGQIGQLGQLSGLESMANYQGLQDVLGSYLSQPESGYAVGGYSGLGGRGGAVPFRAPIYPGTSTGTLPTGGGGAAPLQVQPVTATGTPVYPTIGGNNYPAAYVNYGQAATNAGGVPYDYQDWLNSLNSPNYPGAVGRGATGANDLSYLGGVNEGTTVAG